MAEYETTSDNNTRRYSHLRPTSWWGVDDSLGDCRTVECNRDSSEEYIKRIWKQSVLKDFQHSQYIKLENGYSAHVYDMEVIIAIALQMDTYQALLFRQWFISKVVNRKDCQAEQVKHEYPMIIVMNGTMPRGAS